MKKTMLFALMLLCSVVTFAQSGAKKDTKWKARLRLIEALPPSTSYELGTSDVKIGGSFVPELDFTYFFTKNIAAELILGTTRHTVKLDATELGKVNLLPPTLNLQYHFVGKQVTPYIGAGLNYTIFFNAKKTGAELKYANKVGFSTQIGMDVKLNDKWFLNFDVKKIFLKTDVTVDNLVKLSGVKVNPFVFGIGVGTRF